MINIPEFEWTESGIELLRLINNSILKYGGRGKLMQSLQSEYHNGYACSKIDCDYCYRLNLRLDPEKEITFRKKYKPIPLQYKFQKTDFSYKNFHY